MADPIHPPGDAPLNERLLDLFVFVPAGIAVSVVEDLPRLAELGREKLGVRVSSARAVGQFAMRAGHDEFRRRSGTLLGRVGPQRRTSSGRPTPSPSGSGGGGPSSGPSGPSGPAADRPVHAVPPVANGHVPAVSTLSIPDFDTLSASQVVQRLDGLNRAELVSVRAYEASTRGRRTILSRVDQLLDERS